MDPLFVSRTDVQDRDGVTGPTMVSRSEAVDVRRQRSRRVSLRSVGNTERMLFVKLEETFYFV